MIGVESGDGEGAVGVMNDEGLTNFNVVKQGGIELRELLKENGFGEKSGVNREGRVGSDVRGMVSVSMCEEIVPLAR